MTESSVEYIAAASSEAGAIPRGTPVATHDRASDGKEVQDVFIDPASVLPLPTGAATSANQALELTELQAMNILSSIVFDTILVTYTDSTKAVISKVEWKLVGAVVKTITPTFAATTDTWVKS